MKYIVVLLIRNIVLSRPEANPYRIKIILNKNSCFLVPNLYIIFFYQKIPKHVIVWTENDICNVSFNYLVQLNRKLND